MAEFARIFIHQIYASWSTYITQLKILLGLALDAHFAQNDSSSSKSSCSLFTSLLSEIFQGPDILGFFKNVTDCVKYQTINKDNCSDIALLCCVLIEPICNNLEQSSLNCSIPSFLEVVVQVINQS